MRSKVVEKRRKQIEASSQQVMMKREKQKSTRSIVETSCVKVSEISLRLFFRIPDHSIQYTPSERMTLIEMV